jgi:hypothetical protein
MGNEFSRHAGLGEHGDELEGLKQSGSLDLAAQFLEVKRLRRELRLAQCGRLALAPEEPSQPTPSKRRSPAKSS